MNRLLFKLKTKYIFFSRNRLRSLLSISGCVIGLLLFITGIACLNGYKNYLYKGAECFPDNVLLLTYIDDNDYSDFIKSQDKYTEKIYYTGNSYLLNESYEYQGREMNKSVKLIGIYTDDFSDGIYSEDGNAGYYSKSTLLAGRGITEDDIAEKRRVAVIEEMTAQMLYGRKDCLGETINFTKDGKTIAYEIIGVLKNVESHDRYILNMNKIIEKEDVINLEGFAYVPYTAFFDDSDGSVSTVRAIIYQTSAAEYGEILHEISTFKNIPLGYCTRYTKLQEAENQLNLYSWLLRIITAVIIIFSFAFLMTTWTFSIKERVPEIGMRRAVGASGADIAWQYIVEGIITGSVASMVAIGLSAYISAIIKIIMYRIYYIDYSPSYTVWLILATIGLGAVEGLLFSLIPALVAARVSPSEAVRWE